MTQGRFPALDIVAGNIRFLTPDADNEPDPIPSVPPTTLVLDFLADYFQGRTLPRVGLFQEVMEHHIATIANSMGIDPTRPGCAHFFPMQEPLEPPRDDRNRVGIAIFSSVPLVDVRCLPYGDFDADMPKNWNFDHRGRPMSAMWAQGTLALPGFSPLNLGVTHFTHFGHVKKRLPDKRFETLKAVPPPQLSALDRLIYVLHFLNAGNVPLLASVDANMDLFGPVRQFIDQYFDVHLPSGARTTFGSWSPAIGINLECVIDALLSQGSVGLSNIRSHDGVSDHVLLTGTAELDRI